MLYSTFRLLSIFLFLLIISQAVNAQENYREGVIAKNNGERVEGYIYDWSEVMNCHKVRFKKSPGSEIKEYKPEELRYYSIGPDRYYLSTNLKYTEITRDAYAQGMGEVESSADTVKGRYFARILEGGYASVLYYKDLSDIEHLFIKKGDDDPVELRSSTKILNRGGDYGKKTTELYKGVLRYLFSDCPSITGDIDKYRLNPKDIVKATRRYNVCVSSSWEPDELKLPPGYKNIAYEPPKSKLTFGILGGYSITTIRFRNIPSYKISSANAISVAFSVEYNGARWSDRIWWENRLSISPKKCLQDEYEKQNNPGIPPTVIPSQEIGIVPLDYVSMLKYRLPAGNTAPYIGLGIVWGIPATEFGFEGNLGIDFLTNKRFVPYIVFRTEATLPDLGPRYDLPVAFVFNLSLGIRTN